MTSILYYGVGNPSAFINVFKRINMECRLVTSAEELKNSTKIILPGVGHFDDAMNKLNKSGMVDELNNLVLNKGVPVLGICVGMQIMAKSSDEGKVDGLGWFDANVKELSNKIKPHMGWNNIKFNSNSSPLSYNLPNKLFYFLHSYYFNCNNSSNITATSDYDFDFASIVNKKNIYGVQFHPEKSHSSGEKLIKNFVEKC